MKNALCAVSIIASIFPRFQAKGSSGEMDQEMSSAEQKSNWGLAMVLIAYV